MTDENNLKPKQKKKDPERFNPGGIPKYLIPPEQHKPENYDLLVAYKSFTPRTRRVLDLWLDPDQYMVSAHKIGRHLNVDPGVIYRILKQPEVQEYLQNFITMSHAKLVKDIDWSVYKKALRSPDPKWTELFYKRFGLINSINQTNLQVNNTGENSVSNVQINIIPVEGLLENESE